MKHYTCISKLVVPELDGFNGNPTGNDFVVEVGEIWFDEIDEGYSGCLSNYDGSWLQIDENELEEHFGALEESQ